MGAAILGAPNNATGIGDDSCAQTKCLTVDLLFSQQNPLRLDFELIQAIKQFDVVQAIYINNTSGGGDITIDVEVTLQKLTIPNGKRAYLPIITPKSAPAIVFTSGGNVDVQCLFFNFYISPCVW